MRGRETSKQNRRNICNESHTRARLRIRRFQTVATRPIKYKYLDTSQEKRANKRLPCAGPNRPFFGVLELLGPPKLWSRFRTWRARSARYIRAHRRARVHGSPSGPVYRLGFTRRRSRTPERSPFASSLVSEKFFAFRRKVQLSETSWEINRETSNAGPRSDRARRAHRSEPSARRTGVFASRGTSH